MTNTSRIQTWKNCWNVFFISPNKIIFKTGFINKLKFIYYDQQLILLNYVISFHKFFLFSYSALWLTLRPLSGTCSRTWCPMLLGKGVTSTGRRKVKDLGLAVSYTSGLSVQKFICRLMCLPFLPHEHITLLFTNMILLDTPTSPMPPLLHQLLNYIQTNWIYSNICPLLPHGPSSTMQWRPTITARPGGIGI